MVTSRPGLRARAGGAALWVALASACASAPPPVDAVLAPSPEAVPGEEDQPEAVQARLDADAQELRARAAAGAGAGPCVDAARALFLAAELRHQRALLAALDAAPGCSLDELLAIDERVGDVPREEIRALCEEGLALATRADELEPGRADAQLYRALHLSLVAWAEGPLVAFARDRGPALVSAIDAAVDASPELEGAAPLRVEGRFRDRAPWPYGDRSRARAALEEAVRLAPTPINLLFLGDALHAAGEVEAALARWAAAVEAVPDATTRAVAPFQREQARRRLAAAAVAGSGE